MATLLLIVACALLTCIYLDLTRRLANHKFLAFAKANNCSPIRTAQDQNWPWGLARLYALLTARRNGKDALDDYMAPPLYEHKTLQRQSIGGSYVIETAEPAIAQAILSTQSSEFALGSTRRRVFRPVEGPGISAFTSDGADWHYARAMLRTSFGKERLNDLEATERNLELMFEAIEATGADGWTDVVDMQPLVYRFVLDSATKFLFGESVESQTAFMKQRVHADAHDARQTAMSDLAISDGFAESFDTVLHWLFLRFRLRGLAFLGTSATFRRANQTLKRFLKYAIDKQLNTDSSKSSASMLSGLTEKTRNPDDLRAQLTGLLFAGRDATGSLILLTLLLLSRHPEIYAKLRSLTLEAFPEPHGTPLDYTHIQNFRYLRHIINETLRLYSVLPLNSRIATKDTVIPIGGGEDGKQPAAVHKGQQIMLNIYAMHRLKDLWGDDALEFNPERWEDPKRNALLEDGWAFIPFSRGPRVCIGQQYALTEASYCLVRFVQRFDRLAPDPEDPGKGADIKKAIAVAMAPAEAKLRLHRGET
ncbi:hypothetical protein B0A48_07210 [Cryoendolithus antarcticus]|uniref:Cytochrome P450 n=1 Tax=Cryoendolithus antarcticus TaxID=1507870 RepID=A0A1V8T7Y0_9PEZI|nr:hypothetical protein B0A48_07210 [Cryoendolithus antarcticus]